MAILLLNFENKCYVYPTVVSEALTKEEKSIHCSEVKVLFVCFPDS